LILTSQTDVTVIIYPRRRRRWLWW